MIICMCAHDADYSDFHILILPQSYIAKMYIVQNLPLSSSLSVSVSVQDCVTPTRLSAGGVLITSVPPHPAP